MNLEPISPKNFWQIFFSTLILVSGVAILQTVQRLADLQVIFWRSQWIFIIALFAVTIAAAICALTKLRRADTPRWVEEIESLKTNKPLGAFLILLGFSLFWIFRFRVFGNTLPQTAPILWILLWGTLLQTLGAKLLFNIKTPIAFALFVLLQGLVFQIYGSLTVVSAYPFSIGYSEASRHYYASMFHAQSLYGLELPYPFLHPTRYMLLSLPFLIQGLPLWAHRLWQSILWVTLTGASSMLFAKRLDLKGWMYFFVSAWAYLYFLQGAVYYHLQVCVILILAGVSSKNISRSLVFIILASLWAGMSRVNWFPVPAMLAIAIYLLESPVEQKGWRYWLAPFLYGIAGIISAVAAQFFYIAISGNQDARNFGSSFTSDLIWARLLPNEIFSGVLLGIAFVSAPLILAVIQNLRGKNLNVQPLRALAMFAMLLVLFLGGLVVSVKIGGGGDLHNMDAYIVLLALLSASLLTGRIKTEDGKNFTGGAISAWVVASALLIPLMYAIPRVGNFYRYDSAAARKDIQTLQKYAEESSGEVLFVTERQLFTFGELKNIPLIPEYEQIELMEFAMSGNRAELEKFYADLNSKRFTYIIAEDQKFVRRKSGVFMEEDNAWVKFVGAPILCAYKPIDSLSTTNIEIFVPRPNPKCKNPFEK